MRLLHTNALCFEEFYNSSIPRYAILSHRWGGKEISYKEFQKGKALEGPGLTKIRKSCALAAEHGFDWIWIDACCIDNRSSAELSEAINSMYRWYKSSAVCFVYLRDVQFSPSELCILKDLQSETQDDGFFEFRYRSFSTYKQWAPLRTRFHKSSWFKRGWTLQELLAPSRISFFDKDWNYIGNLSQLRHDISKATGIDLRFLSDTFSPVGFGLARHPSVAQKMSWASRRITSKDEDMAYCLLGIFNVNMPLLYGEGARKAFYRLQIEIVKSSDDESIFAWTANLSVSSIFAAEPSQFAHSKNIVKVSSCPNNRPPPSLTSKGLQLSIPQKHFSSEENSPLPVYLSCVRELDKGDGNVVTETYALCIQLCRCGESYYRVRCPGLRRTRWESYSPQDLQKDLETSRTVYANAMLDY